MTLTSQALEDEDAADYEKIKKRHLQLSSDKQKELGDEQAKIVQEAIGSVDPETRATIIKKMAPLIKSQILTNPKFKNA
jgi:hypothetical protein